MIKMNKPVDMICKFCCESDAEKEEEFAPVPIKFRFTKPDESRVTVNVDDVKSIEHEGKGTNHIIIYRCVTYQENRAIEYLLRFIAKRMEWELYRIL